MSEHLSQVHQLTSEQRKPWLKVAIFSHQATHSLSPNIFPTGVPQGLSFTFPRIMPQGVPPYPDFWFKHKFSLLVVGPTQCGKTWFVKNLLKANRIQYPSKEPIRIWWYYNQWQDQYQAMQSTLGRDIQFIQGLPNLSENL